MRVDDRAKKYESKFEPPSYTAIYREVLGYGYKPSMPDFARGIKIPIADIPTFFEPPSASSRYDPSKNCWTPAMADYVWKRPYRAHLCPFAEWGIETVVFPAKLQHPKPPAVPVKDRKRPIEAANRAEAIETISRRLDVQASDRSEPVSAKKRSRPV
jgi:hypothetical protein